MHSNYKQALHLVEMLTDQLCEMMRALAIPSENDFSRWREEEKIYLMSLMDVPAVDTMKIEYLQTLKKLRAAEYVSRFMVVYNTDFVTQGKVRSNNVSLGECVRSELHGSRFPRGTRNTNSSC